MFVRANPECYIISSERDVTCDSSHTATYPATPSEYGKYGTGDMFVASVELVTCCRGRSFRWQTSSYHCSRSLSLFSLLTAYKTVIIIIIPSLVFLVSAQLSFLLLRNFQLEPCSPQMSQRLLVLDLLQSCVVLLPFIPVQNLSQYTTRPPNVLVRLPILVPLQATRPTAIQLP